MALWYRWWVQLHESHLYFVLLGGHVSESTLCVWILFSLFRVGRLYSMHLWHFTCSSWPMWHFGHLEPNRRLVRAPWWVCHIVCFINASFWLLWCQTEYELLCGTFLWRCISQANFRQNVYQRTQLNVLRWRYIWHVHKLVLIECWAPTSACDRH